LLALNEGEIIMKRKKTNMESKSNIDHSKLKVDLIKIFVSFLLVSIIGGLLSHVWQNREYNHQTEIEQLKFEKEIANKYFEEVSRQLDRQISNFQLLKKDSLYAEKCRKDYLEWDENKTRFKAMAEKYFGDSAAKSISYFNNQFKLFFFVLVVGEDFSDPINISDKLNEVEKEIENFNTQLIDNLLKGDYGNKKQN
jgi:hypothetical protein